MTEPPKEMYATQPRRPTGEETQGPVPTPSAIASTPVKPGKAVRQVMIV
jgi:hypothetical protein